MQNVWNEGYVSTYRGVVMERKCMTVSLFFFSYPRDTRTKVRRKVDGYRLLLMTGNAWGRQKGKAALWWQYQATQTEPEDFYVIFRGQLVFTACSFPKKKKKSNLLNGKGGKEGGQTGRLQEKWIPKSSSLKVNSITGPQCQLTRWEFFSKEYFSLA